jgi:putative transposase
MRNHWHFVIWPREDGELTGFLRWLTHTHIMRWHVAHGTMGCGPLYQGRFKSFPVHRDEHFLTVCRYVERNALTAGVVDRAEDWRWGSLWARRQGDARLRGLLSAWPVDRPGNWVRAVNRPMSAKEQERMQTSITRNRPFGSEPWQKRTAGRLGLTASLRSEGRPRKTKAAEEKN